MFLGFATPNENSSAIFNFFIFNGSNPISFETTESTATWSYPPTIIFFSFILIALGPGPSPEKAPSEIAKILL